MPFTKPTKKSQTGLLVTRPDRAVSVGLAFREGILAWERNSDYKSQMCPHCSSDCRQMGSRKWGSSFSPMR